MIVIVVIFLVCQTPAFVNQLVYVIGVPDSCGRPYYYYYHASNIAVSANSAVNFVVYCVFRRLFRRRLADFCRCRAAAAATDATPRDSLAAAGREPWPPGMDSVIVDRRVPLLPSRAQPISSNKLESQ